MIFSNILPYKAILIFIENFFIENVGVRNLLLLAYLVGILFRDVASLCRTRKFADNGSCDLYGLWVKIMFVVHSM